MVQSVGSVTDAFSLFQLSGATRAASGGATSGAASFFGSKTPGAISAETPTKSTASILDDSQAQTTSGDFANVFQRLSSGLQSLMVQLQSKSGGAANSASSSSTADASTAEGATADVAGPPVGASAEKADLLHHASGGNRALQGDADAMINDLHGFIQVASGDALAAPDAAPAAATANDNAAVAVLSSPISGGGADSTVPTAAVDGTAAVATTPSVPSASSDAATAPPASSGNADAAAVGDTTYAYAQTLMQALQNYSAASASVSNPQSNAVSAVG